MTEARPLALLDVPDPARRVQKARWSQLCEVVTSALAIETEGVATGRGVVLYGADPALARAVSRRLERPVSAQPPPSDRTGPREREWSASVVLIPESSSPGDRIGLVRSALGHLRPAGVLVVVTTVVKEPHRDEVPPSISQLLEELAVASGCALHEESVSSVRWVGEELLRGVALTMRYLINEEV